MCFCDGHDVDVVLFHVPDDGVDFGCFHESCGVPAAKSGEAFAGDLVSLLVSVVLWWLEAVSFEPVCSGGLHGVLLLSVVGGARWG